MPAVVQTMPSTPNSQGMDADKKRNKLGYHRTSVACVHCRRRKIRCLVAADDAQGRCENCIRLRKECQFFPVDQQPPLEKKSRPSSRLDPVATNPIASSASSSSPPAHLSAADHLHHHQPHPHPPPDPAFFQQPYQPIPMNPSPDVSSPFFPQAPMATSTTFAPAPTLDPAVPWDEFTTISDPNLLATMAAAGKAPMVPSGAPVAPVPPTASSSSSLPLYGPASLPNTPTVPSQSQSHSHSHPHSQAVSPAPTPPYATAALHPQMQMQMHPDGSVWPVPPPPARAMTAPFPTQTPDPSMAAAPPPYPTAQQQQQQQQQQQFAPQPMPPDLKRRMTSPAQSVSGAPMHAHAPPQSPQPDLHPGPISVSYPGQMAFPGWHDMSLNTMDMVQYPMYAGDPSTAAAGFGSPQPPMGHGHGHGHPGPGQSPGS